MPRSRKEMAADAHAAARVINDAPKPLRFEEIRSLLGAAGVALTIKQMRLTLELAEQLHLVERVNRSRWGAVGTAPLPSPARRSRADAVIDAASRLLELPASIELNRAVRTVLRLATEQGARPVLSHGAPRVASVLPAKMPPAPASGAPERKANGANDAADKIEIRIDPHS